MPSFLRTVNFDRMFNNSEETKIIINDLPNRTEQDREYFNYLVRTTYTSDMVSALPKCFCGAEYGEHKIGKTCESCGHPVKQDLDKDITPMLWFRTPKGIPKLISPYFLILLREQYNKRGVNIIEWLINKQTPVPRNYPAVIDKLISDNIPRGYNNFVNHFDEIIAYLSKLKDFNRNRFTTDIVAGMLGPEFEGADPIDIFLKDFRENIFANHIPIPNKMFVVLEKTDLGMFVENSIFDIQNVVNTMLSIDIDHYETKLSSIENRTAKILTMLSDYYYSYITTRFRPKKGHYRKHVYGGRGNHSFRAVITSHEEVTDHDEIWLPWAASVSVFWLHLLNYLLRPSHEFGRFTYQQATSFLLAHIENYHPLLDYLFQKLIAESPNGHIAIIEQRNPSLKKGSAQLIRATKVKTDPKDYTVSVSDLTAVSFNADYDGRSNIRCRH